MKWSALCLKESRHVAHQGEDAVRFKFVGIGAETEHQVLRTNQRYL